MKRLAALLCALALLLALGCSPGAQGNDEITLYFLAGLGDDMGAASLDTETLSVSRNADKVTAALRALLSGTGSHPSPYASGVTLESVGYDGGLITVELSEDYLAMTGADRSGAEACAALTLCEIEGITGVRFTVAGASYMSADGYMSADDVITGDLSLKPMKREATIYFSDGSPNYVVGEVRYVVLRENAMLERYVIEELIKGPADDSLHSTLPRGTSLLSISTENGVCLVNFSAEFARIREESLAGEIQTLTAVTNSLCAVEGVDSVQYYVAGERFTEQPMYSDSLAVGKYADETMDCMIYLVSRDGQHAVPVLMRVGTEGGFDLNRLVVERLASGIDGDGFMSPMPGGTRVNSVTLENGVCTVDLSAEFLRSELPMGMSRELVLQTIAHTLAETGEGVESVTVLVDGKEYRQGITPDSSYIIADKASA